MEGQVPARSPRWIRGLAFVLVLVVLAMTMLNHGRRRSRGRMLPGIVNLKNLALAVHNYATSNNTGVLPFHTPSESPISWRVDVLRYLDREDLARQYDRNTPWNQEPNAAIGREWLRVFDAPEVDYKTPNTSGWAPSDYGLISGPGTVNPGDHAVTLQQISDGDGLGLTLLIGECAGLKLGWTEPRDPRVDREKMGIELLGKPDQTSDRLLSGYMTGCVGVAFADGSARALSDKIDPKVLAAITTVEGSEPITLKDVLK